MGVAATLLTVSAPPVGADESFVSVSVDEAVVLPAASAPVTTSVGGTAANVTVKRVVMTGTFPAGTTVQVGWQSAAGECLPQGMSCFASTTQGLGVGRICKGGHQAADYAGPMYTNRTGGVDPNPEGPNNRGLLLGGPVPQTTSGLL